MAKQGAGEAINNGDGLFYYRHGPQNPIIIIEAPQVTKPQCLFEGQPLVDQTNPLMSCSHSCGIHTPPNAESDQIPNTVNEKPQATDPVQNSPAVRRRNKSSLYLETNTTASCSDDDCLFCNPQEAEADRTPSASTENSRVNAPDQNPPVFQRRRASTTIEVTPPTPKYYRCSLHNPEPSEPEKASSPVEGSNQAPDPVVDTSQEKDNVESSAVKETPHVRFSPTVNNKVVFEMDGTRIFQTTSPSTTLYQLSHPITWNADDKFDGLTLTAMTQLPYIPARMGARRVCDIQFLGVNYDHDDAYPQALIRSPSWGLNHPLLQFFYESKGQVMGLSNLSTSDKRGRHKPSLVMAAAVVEKDRAMERPKLDYPKGEYRIQWLQVQGERIVALELCDMIPGEDGRLKRRYRLTFNRTKVTEKVDVDLLVATWCTRVWMEEVFMKAMKTSHKEFVKQQAKKRSKHRRRRAYRKLSRASRRVTCRPSKHYYRTYRN